MLLIKQDGWSGGRRGWAGVTASACALDDKHVPLFQGCVLMNAACLRRLSGSAAAEETDGRTNPTVPRLLSVSLRPGAICDGAG